eukprot:6588073-Heterocapsa_arctica.AAC.1
MARRELPAEIPACAEAHRLFEFRQYQELGLGQSLLTFLDLPMRSFCLNISWAGQLILLDAEGLMTLR